MSNTAFLLFGVSLKSKNENVELGCSTVSGKHARRGNDFLKILWSELVCAVVPSILGWQPAHLIGTASIIHYNSIKHRCIGISQRKDDQHGAMNLHLYVFQCIHCVIRTSLELICVWASAFGTRDETRQDQTRPQRGKRFRIKKGSGEEKLEYECAS